MANGHDSGLEGTARRHSGRLPALCCWQLAIFLYWRRLRILHAEIQDHCLFPLRKRTSQGAVVLLDGVTDRQCLRHQTVSDSATPNRSVEVGLQLNKSYHDMIRADSDSHDRDSRRPGRPAGGTHPRLAEQASTRRWRHHFKAWMPAISSRLSPTPTTSSPILEY